jgi:hypothetical protein
VSLAGQPATSDDEASDDISQNGNAEASDVEIILAQSLIQPSEEHKYSETRQEPQHSISHTPSRAKTATRDRQNGLSRGLSGQATMDERENF